MRIIAMQEIARAGCGGVGAGLFSHTIGAPPILHRGSEAMKARVLPQILSGEKISALAITEPSGGSDVANLRTTARRDGDHLRDQRLEDLHHLGHARGLHHACGANRRPRRERREPDPDRGPAGRLAAHVAEEDGLVVLRHRDALFRERPRPGGEPDRQGGRGIPRHHAQLQRREAARRGGRDCGRARLPRGGGRLTPKSA